MEKKYTRLKFACYSMNITMGAVGNLSPLLFLSFRSEYGLSYSLLGLLVLVNFCTQLTMDLIFSFFSHKFNMEKAVKSMPYIAIVGFLLYALLPLAFPDFAYLGILLGTVIFSASSGFAEVLLSPVIAAIPSENPEREMSKLHSVYAWGTVGVVVISTLYLFFVGSQYWHFLAMFFTLIPLAGAILFFGQKLPPLETPQKVEGVMEHLKKKEVWLCVFAIFLGGASECTMAQWCSGYVERALALPKIWGDIFGVALFAATLGIGRSLYAKIGKNIEKVLLLGSLGATVCYLVAALVGLPIFGLIACAFTGFCVSMLWPGSLVVSAEKVPTGGVFMYAMMAAGGDLGASVGPQLVGVITDGVSASAWGGELSKTLGITAEQLGMKTGMLVGALFPLVGVFVFLSFYLSKRKNAKKPLEQE